MGRMPATLARPPFARSPAQLQPTLPGVCIHIYFGFAARAFPPRHCGRPQFFRRPQGVSAEDSTWCSLVLLSTRPAGFLPKVALAGGNGPIIPLSPRDSVAVR